MLCTRKSIEYKLLAIGYWLLAFSKNPSYNLTTNLIPKSKIENFSWLNFFILVPQQYPGALFLRGIRA
jgi:hypothetical protein